MKPFTDPSQPRPALVVVVPGPGGLWNPHALQLVASLEDRLDTFVTFASAGGGVPTLADGLAACRFMKAPGVVVVDTSRSGSEITVDPGSDAGPWVVPACSEASPSAVESAYHAATLSLQAAAG